MKRLFLLVGLLLAGIGFPFRSPSQVFTWTTDTATNFDLTITGVGGLGSNSRGAIAGWDGTVTSPSGLWTFHDVFSVQPVGLADVTAGIPLQLTNGCEFIAWLADGDVCYNPTGLTASTVFFNDLLYGPSVGYYRLYSMRPVLVPLSGGGLQALLLSGGNGLNPFFDGGGISFTVWTSADVTDASTWSWALRVQESVRLTTVPEPSPISILALLIPCWRRGCKFFRCPASPS